jgi:hypothetical protein
LRRNKCGLYFVNLSKKLFSFIMFRYFYEGRIQIDNDCRTGIGTYMVWYNYDAEQRSFP